MAWYNIERAFSCCWSCERKISRYQTLLESKANWFCPRMGRESCWVRLPWIKGSLIGVWLAYACEMVQFIRLDRAHCLDKEASDHSVQQYYWPRDAQSGALWCRRAELNRIPPRKNRFWSSFQVLKFDSKSVTALDKGIFHQHSTYIHRSWDGSIQGWLKSLIKDQHLIQSRPESKKFTNQYSITMMDRSEIIYNLWKKGQLINSTTSNSKSLFRDLLFLTVLSNRWFVYNR